MTALGVPPIPGVTEQVRHQGPMDAMVHTTAMRLVEQAIGFLRKAAKIDPMLSGKISDALAPLGAGIPDDDEHGDYGEPKRPKGLQSPSRNY